MNSFVKFEHYKTWASNVPISVSDSGLAGFELPQTEKDATKSRVARRYR